MTSDDHGTDLEIPREPAEVLAAMEAEKDCFDVDAMYKSAKCSTTNVGKPRPNKKNAGNPQGQSSAARQRESEQAKATSTCRACGAVGHWAKDPICPKFGRSDGRKNQQVNMVTTMKEDNNHLGVNALPPDAVSYSAVLSTTSQHAELNCPEALGILDSGCQSTVIGLFVNFGNGRKHFWTGSDKKCFNLERLDS